MALRSMGCLSMMLILVVLGVVQGGRPGFQAGDELGKGFKAHSNSLYYYKVGDQSGKGEKVDPNSLYYYKVADQSGKGEKVDFNSLYYYKVGDQSGKGEKVDFNSLYYYKVEDQSGKGEKVDPNSLYYYKVGDQSGKGEKVDFNSLYYYKGGDQSGKGEKVDFNSLYYYKSGDQLGKGEKVDPNSLYYYKGGDQLGKGKKVDPNSLYYYKVGDQSGKGEKVDFNSLYYYKGGKQLAKSASNHKANEVVSNHETKLDSPRIGAFLKTDLVEGATFRLAERPSTRSIAFLPKTVADELSPLTVGSFPELQRIFNIQEGSDMYTAVETAAQVCDQSSSLPGEERMCATSFESFLDVVSSLVGLDVKMLTNSARPRMDMGPMKMNNFTRHSVQNGQNVVCHTLVFPSLLYMCHVAPDTEVVEASLTDAAGLVIRAIGVCHLDTKMWAPEHLFFKILGVKPGTTLCHWLGSDDMIWVSTKMKKSSVIHEAIPHGEHMAMNMA